MNYKVSIVIIGRNEEIGIAKCIDAALGAADQIGGAEMIYVDSNSTDGTVTIARNYGIQVLPLNTGLRQCPSAGRYTGAGHATGDYILFLDADTLVYEDFLPAAIKYLESNPDVGGVNGYIDDLSENGEPLTGIEERSADVTEVKWLRGPCCFYRRQALLNVGSFNPDIATEEEAELGLRLIRFGWKLNIIPLRMACHTRCYHGQSVETIISTLRRDIRSKRLGEITRTVAYAFKAGNGPAFCWLRLNTTILFIVWAALAVMCLFLPGTIYPAIGLAGLLIAGGAAIYSKKRSLTQTLLFIPAKFVCVIDLLAGLHKIRSHDVGFEP